MGSEPEEPEVPAEVAPASPEAEPASSEGPPEAGPSDAEEAAARGRAGLRFMALVLALNLVIPLFNPDLYPFSSMPMFSSSPLRISQVRVLDPGGEELSLYGFRLNSENFANPAPRIGVRFPASFDSTEALDWPAVEEVARGQLEVLELDYVDVEHTVYGAIEGTQGVGPVLVERRRIRRR